MFCDLSNAAWIFEIETGKESADYWCWDHIPTDKELVVLKQMAQEKYGDVSMRILSRKEVIAAKLGVNPYEFERRHPSRLRLMKNKNGHVVNERGEGALAVFWSPFLSPYADASIVSQYVYDPEAK
jgi:hypothetical protein